ncbi:MAG: DHHA1 domain-containing protein, partial [Clostridia bacterium]|nr:DHHA1 domain-containing protein [Clostridia bacterium]
LKNRQLLSLAIHNIYAMENEQILVSHISHEEAEMYYVKFEDYVGIINSLATIAGNKLVCFIESNGSDYYVSMRAKKGYDVSAIAQKHNGGGHKGAAAFNCSGTLEEIETMMKKEFVELLHSSKEEKDKVF